MSYAIVRAFDVEVLQRASVPLWLKCKMNKLSATPSTSHVSQKLATGVEVQLIRLLCNSIDSDVLAANMAQSPASSPRLPSPPPMAEDQIGPASPSVNMLEDSGKLGTMSNIDQGASRRIRPGTKSEDILEGPPLIELQDVHTFNLCLCD